MRRRPCILSKGFTLVELLVVMGVIAVLATVLISVINPNTQFAKARDGQRKAYLEQIRSALEQYRADQGSYPVVPNTQYYLITCGTGNSFSGGQTTYIVNFPCDPLGSSQSYNGGNFVYQGTTGTTYNLVACLEIASDPQAISASQLPSGIPSSNCGTKKFYLVTNP